MEGNGSVVATVATTAPVVETAITGTQNETPIDNVETQSIETTETTQTNETADDDSYSLDSETETETTEEQVALSEEKFNEIIPDESIREIAKSIFGDGITEEQAKKFLEAVILDEQKQDAQRAEELALECCQPTEEFEWYPVSTAVGNVRNQGAELIKPL